MPKRYSDEPAFIKELLTDPEDDQDEESPQNGGPPAIQPPRKHITTHEREKNHRGILAHLLDPWARSKNRHDVRRFNLELGTGTELLHHRSETTLAKSKINQKAQIYDHRDKAKNWLGVKKLKNSADAITAKYSDFQDKLNQIAEQQLDPMLRQKQIEEMYRNYQPRCDDGCDECEEDEEP